MALLTSAWTNPESVAPLLVDRGVVPVAIGDLSGLLLLVVPDVLVDARMRKRDRPKAQRELVMLTIGLGPNFVAGGTIDIVVETSWEQTP